MGAKNGAVLAQTGPPLRCGAGGGWAQRLAWAASEPATDPNPITLHPGEAQVTRLLLHLHS